MKTIEHLPNDVIFLLLGWLDPLSMIRLGLVSRELYYFTHDDTVTNVLLAASKSNPGVKCLIESSEIEKDLQKGNLNVREFVASVLHHKVDKLAQLLKPYKLTLFYPCYNWPPRKDLVSFYKDKTYQLFFNPACAKKNISNYSNVNHLHKIQVSSMNDTLNFQDIDKGLVEYIPSKVHSIA